jgi:hypothetical protein
MCKLKFNFCIDCSMGESSFTATGQRGSSDRTSNRTIDCRLKRSWREAPPPSAPRIRVAFLVLTGVLWLTPLINARARRLVRPAGSAPASTGDYQSGEVSMAGSLVSRVWALPSAFITYISELP